MEVGEIETQMDVDGLDVAVCIRLPATATASNPVPGVVFVDGSGPSHRHDFGPQPPWFLDAGFAVLTYDKPGCGDTAGDWRSQTLPDRARHAAAALEKLRRQNGVDSRRVGLWGASQGGWVVPLAAGQDPSVAFAMLVSSADVSPFEQEAIWGENDPLVPVAQSERVFREGLAAAGNRDVTVVVFPAADHWIMVEDPGGEREWAPGYIATP